MPRASYLQELLETGHDMLWLGTQDAEGIPEDTGRIQSKRQWHRFVLLYIASTFPASKFAAQTCHVVPRTEGPCQHFAGTTTALAVPLDRER